ncbi:50S ribosomal protein L4 [Sphingobacteriales bacterium UPWRP_1]|nr:50S ribosomal protein L4 [Sphingobacteriales bacterium TSM_CSS]PSJ76846.1 50S ribosomal protein L4 [Sphingobacteriales bacterium UPWRP_1]
MRVDILNINGQNTGRTVELPDAVFGVEPNEHVMYLAVKQYLAAQRQGTHKTKEKWEVSRSTRKIKRQKGTGGARAGSLKNPMFKGGGTIFGPKPRNYSFKLNKKVKALARNSALSVLAKDSRVVVVEDFNFDLPKTKQYVKVLQNLGLSDKKTLLVLNEVSKNVHLSLRNLPNAAIATAKLLNTYSVLNTHTLILSESAAKSFVGA